MFSRLETLATVAIHPGQSIAVDGIAEQDIVSLVACQDIIAERGQLGLAASTKQGRFQLFGGIDHLHLPGLENVSIVQQALLQSDLIDIETVVGAVAAVDQEPETILPRLEKAGIDRRPVRGVGQ